MLASGGLDLHDRQYEGQDDRCLKGLDGEVYPATNKRFELEFCTIARWKNGEIVEEKLFYSRSASSSRSVCCSGG